MRKTKEITVPSQGYGRDAGKVFVIVEQAAAVGEQWAARAVEALAKSGVTMPDMVEGGGLAALWTIGLRAFLGAPAALVIPLMDEMFVACVSVVPNPKDPKVVRGAGIPDGADRAAAKPVGPLVPEDTEEIRTRLLLRSEIVELHTGFSAAAFLSQKWAEAQAAASILRTTETSEGESGSSSPPASPRSRTSRRSTG